MKILLLGANGQVGWELQRSLAPLGDVKVCDRSSANLESLDALRNVVREYGPTIIVNAAAYTAVDKAESEPAKAKAINTDAVVVLADEAKRLNAWLIHYSTDYVFDGSKPGSYVESDETNPQSVYGQTKLDGEEAIRRSGCRHLIFRTSWVYALRGANFAKTMIRLAKERDELKVVADQFGAPTSASLIADVTALCLYNIELREEASCDSLSGIYNLVPHGETTWHGFASYVIASGQERGESFQVSAENIQAITAAEFPVPAKRPANSRLIPAKLEKQFSLSLPQWQVHVDKLITEIVGQ